MGFSKKTWSDRVAEFINRRLLTKENGTTELVTVSRSEGVISKEGDMFSAENMNALETRIYNAFNDVSKIYTNVSVATSAWGTYTASLTNESDIVSDYPYKADIALSGLTANHAVTVHFSPNQSADGVFAPYVNSQSGKVRIYANAKPTSTITIPTITAIAKGV